MQDLKFPIHAIIQIERDCSCGATPTVQTGDCGMVPTPYELEEAISGQDTPIIKLKCSKCGLEEWPQYIAIVDQLSNRRILRAKLGTPSMPVVKASNDELPYAYLLTPEESTIFDRGVEKMEDVFAEHEKNFWAEYTAWALVKWDALLKDLQLLEFQVAYTELGIDVAPYTSALGFRKDANRRFNTAEKKTMFWRLANRELVNHFLWLDPQNWHVKEWVNRYGRDRIAWLVLYFPLPEELEEIRTQRLAELAPKKAGEYGMLWERIGQLGRQLDKINRRNQTLAEQLYKVRQENEALRKQLKEESKRETVSVERNPDDIRKIRELKGLIKQLREEVTRLEELLPKESTTEAEPEDVLETEPLEQPVNLTVLAGKTIGIFGWQNETAEIEGCRIVWHHGDSVDINAERLVREADIYVFLTRFGSHQVMWWLKEIAIDYNKEVFFLRERNVYRILERLAQSL